MGADLEGELLSSAPWTFLSQLQIFLMDHVLLLPSMTLAPQG